MVHSRIPYFSVILIFFTLSLVGWLFIPNLSISLQKESVSKKLNISTSWPFASAQEVEKELTSLLEASINTMGGVTKITSVSKSGLSEIEVQISGYHDMDQFRLLLTQSIRRLYTQLPTGVSYPKIISNKNNENNKAVLIYTLRSADDLSQIEEHARYQIKSKLALLKGLDRIEVLGGQEFETIIHYDRKQLQLLGISEQDILTAIHRYYGEEDLGWAIQEESINSDSANLMIPIKLVSGDFGQLANIPIAMKEGRIFKLNQLARISSREKSPTGYFRINGQNAIRLILYARANTNELSLVKEVENEMRPIIENLPIHYQLEESYKSTIYVQNELDKIYQRTILTIIILLLFVALVYWNASYILLLVLSLLTTISISFLFYMIFGIDIHLYSLAGMTISLGLIIDNAIIMADHLRSQGNLKVFTALLASTVTTAASLLVIWFLPQELKMNLWDFAAIIMINLMVSLLVALFFIPALFQALKLKSKHKYNSYKKRRICLRLNFLYIVILRRLLQHRKIAILMIILMFGLPLFMLPSKFEGESLAAKAYNQSLGSEWYKDHLKATINKYLGGSFRLFNVYVFETSKHSKPEETKLFIDAALAKGGSIHQLNDIMEDMESFLLNYQDEIWFQMSIHNPQEANISIHFSDQTNSYFPYQLKNKIIGYGKQYGAVNWKVYGVGKAFSQMEGLGESIHFKLSLKGFNLENLNEWAFLIQSKLEENPRVAEVNCAAKREWWKSSKSYEYVGIIDMEKLYDRNMDMEESLYDIKLQSSNRKNEFSISNRGRVEDIKLSPAGEGLNDDWSLLYVSDSPFKAGEYMEIQQQEEEEAIYKENQSYIKLIDYKYIGGMRYGSLYTEEVIEEIARQLPMGFGLKSLQYRMPRKDSGDYTIAVLIIVLIIYLVCSILFESLKWPFAIIFMVPFSFIGIFLIFYLFDLNFDQGGYASFVLVSGLVVNSSIYILNEFSNIKKVNQQSSIRIYIKAFNRKIIPILLTISSTILGLIPFILSGQNEVFWFALAIGAIGGLVFSIFLLLFYFPLFILKAMD